MIITTDGSFAYNIQYGHNISLLYIIDFLLRMK
jgi:hypothetical protein